MWPSRVADPATSALDLLLETAGASRQWVIADEDLIEAVKAQRGVARRRVGRLTRLCLRAAGLLRLDIVVCRVAGTLQLVALVRRAWQHAPPAADAGAPVRVFVGFGARAEEAMFERYCTRSATPAVRVREQALEESGLARITMREALRCFRDAMRDVRELVEALPDGLAWQRAEILTAVMRRAAPYGFATAWWREIARTRTIEDAAFLAVNAQAYAAVACGVPTTYMQHGLLSRTLLFAEFDTVEPLTADEARYFRRKLPRARVQAPALREAAPAPADRSVVIASGHRPLEQMQLALPLIEHFEQRGFSVHVRLFPGEAESRFWSAARDTARFEWAPAAGAFEDLLARLRPAYVISWGSTALVESLYRGIIPITLAEPDDALLDNTVFPLFARCLRWPEEQTLLDASMASGGAYADVLGLLRRRDLDAAPEPAVMPARAHG